MNKKQVFSPPAPTRQDEVLREKKKAIEQQKMNLREALSMMVGDKQRDTIENWLRTAETEDLEAEYKGLLAASKTLGPLSEDFRSGLELTRRVIADMSRQLRINQRRDKQVKKRLASILNLVKNWDKIENKEEQIKQLEQAIENIGASG